MQPEVVTVDKVVRDNMVAVLHTNRHGAGWSTWNRDHPSLVFDPATVAWVEAGMKGKTAYVHSLRSRFKGILVLGLDNLAVTWVPVGAAFEVVEYDGIETIRFRDQIEWKVA
jgi:hypothetical protein